MSHKYARLARASDRMPWNGRPFGVGTDHEGFELVDDQDGFTLFLIGDGSIEWADPLAATAPAPEPETETPHAD